MVAVSPAGKEYGGMDAVVELLSLAGFRAARLIRLPVIHPIARFGYRIFARNRNRISMVCRKCMRLDRKA